MIELLSALLAAAAAAASTVPSPSPAVAAPKKPIDAVSQAAIQNAFQILRTAYIRSGDLTFEELNRSALQGLLQRLDFGAELVTSADAALPALQPGVLAERLTPQIGYLRPLALSGAEVSKLEAELREFRQAKVPHLILDLRNPAPPGDFATAAAILDLFLPHGQLLFRLKQVGRDEAELFVSNTDAVWPGHLVVLIDAETNNLGETIAAVLRDQKRAILVGGATRGATVRYDTVPLDDARLLRFAHAEMLLPDGGSLFKKGLQPDFAVPLTPADKRKAFDVTDEGQSVRDAVFDQARIRYNEAALVARKHPELDAYIRRSAGEQTEGDQAGPRDTVLQRAVDMLTASQHLADDQLPWPAPDPAATDDEPPAVADAPVREPGKLPGNAKPKPESNPKSKPDPQPPEVRPAAPAGAPPSNP